MDRKLSMDELQRMELEDFLKSPKIPLTVVLEDVRSGHNVGAVFRTSDAFAIEEIILCGITPQPPQRDILKSALGATESVRWRHEKAAVETIKCLQKDGFKCLAIEQTEKSIDLENWSWSGESIAVVLGNEVRGVSAELVQQVDGCLEIAQFGTKHSLNVSVCAGIVIHHLANTMRK